MLGIEGEDLERVSTGLELLRTVNTGHNVDLGGERVLVVGGGNVAIDVARTAARLGASEVHLMSLERRHEMPAHLELRSELPKTSVGKLSKKELAAEEREKMRVSGVGDRVS